MRTGCVLVGAALLCSVAAGEDQVQFNRDGFLLIDGKPRLLIGLYEQPDKDAVLEQVAQSGFNLVRADADKAALDRLQAHGLYAWISLGGQLELHEGDQAARQRLIQTVDAFKGHPALLGWEGPDEALWMSYFAAYDWLMQEQPRQLMERIGQAAAKGDPNAAKHAKMLEKAADLTQRSMWKECEELYDALWKGLGRENPRPELRPTVRIRAAQELGDDLTRGWECVRERDSKHVFWQNHAPCNSTADLRRHNRAVHAAGCDIYPAPGGMGVRHGQSLRDPELTAVGLATDLMRQGAPGKACWMVLQGFGWTDLKDDPFNPTDPVRGRRPNLQETRFMAYDALLHGANAILYWGTYTVEKDSALWNDLMKTAKELRALEPAIVAPKPDASPVVAAETDYTTFSGGDPKLMIRQVGGDWVLIAVNEWRFGVAFDVCELPKAFEAKTLYRLYCDEEHVVKDGKFHDGIVANGVHVYATSRRFEPR